MLIEFTIRNFMSYRDEVSLSMVASTTVKECESNDGYSNVSTMDNGKRYLGLPPSTVQMVRVRVL